jgi:hypothetical protein
MADARVAAIDATASPQNLTKISRTIRRGCGVGRRITGVRLTAKTERTGALKTGTAHLHAPAPVVYYQITATCFARLDPYEAGRRSTATIERMPEAAGRARESER